MIEVRTSQITDVGDEFNKGVFASTLIKEGTCFHRAPVLPYPNEQHEHIEKTYLADYAFEYGEHHTAFLLGYGMMFNHSYEPNAVYEINFDNHSFDFYAYRDIQPDEEIFINYNGEAENDDPLWFNKEEEEQD